METWSVNGIDLAVRAEGSGPLVVLAHGFPDLALTWRLQVPALVEAGYRVVAPDMRGYGASARPAEVEAYRNDVLAEDLVGLLDREGVDRAHFVGHDWGASTVWPLGLTHPDRLLSLAGLSVPYAPPSPAPPTEIFRRRLGEDFYMLRFHRDEVIPELERDVAHTLALVLNGRLDLDLGDGGRTTRLAPGGGLRAVRRRLHGLGLRTGAELLPQPRPQLAARHRSRRPDHRGPVALRHRLRRPGREVHAARPRRRVLPFAGGAHHRRRRPLGAPGGAGPGQCAAARPPGSGGTARLTRSRGSAGRSWAIPKQRVSGEMLVRRSS